MTVDNTLEFITNTPAIPLGVPIRQRSMLDQVTMELPSTISNRRDMIEIHANNPVNNQVQGLESNPRVNEVKQEEEKSNGQQAAQAEENPDYRVNLSEMSRQKIAEMTNPISPPQDETRSDLTEQEAADLAQETANQLAQTNVTIANQAMQKAVDLFS